MIDIADHTEHKTRVEPETLSDKADLMGVFESDTNLVPSLTGQPFIAMLVQMGLLLGTLLCMQWTYATVGQLVERPYPFRHVITSMRLVKLLMLIAALLVAMPRLVMLMCWNTLTPDAREALAQSTWTVRIAWGAVIAAAWTLDRRARTGERAMYFRTDPFYEKRTGAGQKQRGILLFFLIFVVAGATTYVRPAPVHEPVAVSTHR